MPQIIRIDENEKLDRQALENHLAALSEHAGANGDKELQGAIMSVCAISSHPQGKWMQKFMYMMQQFLKAMPE
jgi:hypothetical protein